MEGILFDPETSIRRALIQALGTFGTDRLSPGERDPLVDKLHDLYRNDPDAGIHGAAEWTLRRWQQQEKLKATQAELTKVKEPDGRRWYVNGQGQTFVIVEGPVEFRMGSPASEPDRDRDEISHRRVIPRRFAIADKEVSVEQYQRFVREDPQFGLDRSYLDNYSPEPDGPMIYVNWFGAAAYCNWLSEQEGLPKDQWCYLRNAAEAYSAGMTIPANVLARTGYRLPTEAEWECACRAGTMTSRYHGLSPDLLDVYARHQANSKDHAWPGGSLLPNDLGLFDTLGNVFEWCQDPYGRYQPGKEGSIIDHINLLESINEKNPRLLRGGTFDSQPAYVRSAYRFRDAPSNRISDDGFRPARTYP
ncbi:MAG: formylglycine-generating enzyme family protein [Isosphaerales bacterium]